MKKILSILSFIMLSLSANAYQAQIDGIYYNFSSSGATVTCLSKYSSMNSSAYSGEVIIPNTVDYKDKTYPVVSIGENAFYGCSSVTSITIPSSVTTIEKSAFNSCSATSITIPNSVTTIGENAFYSCKNLNSITIPNSVTTIGEYAFAFLNLPSITIPTSVTSIGKYAFYYSTSLTSITIPNSVTSIESGVFEYCTDLSSIIIPNSVSFIGAAAFWYTHLQDIYIYSSVPPTCDTDALKGVRSSCTLHVPAGTKESYATSPQWQDLTNIIEDLPDPGIEVPDPGTEVPDPGTITPTECDCANLKAVVESQQAIIESLTKRIEALENHTCGDMNGDNRVTISDVNIVIEKALNQ